MNIRKTCKLTMTGIGAALAIWATPSLDAQPIPPVPGTPPLPITNGIQCWLDANYGVFTNGAGLVTNWLDKSGNGNNAAPTNGILAYAPTYAPKSQNGLPTFLYPGGSIGLDVQDASVNPSSTISGLTDNVTLIFLEEMDTLANPQAGVTKTGGGTADPWDDYTSGQFVQFFINDQGQENGAASTSPIQPFTYNVQAYTWVGGNWTNYFNNQVSAVALGGIYTPGVPGVPGVAVNGPYPMRIGSRGDWATQLIGHFAETLIYQPALSDSDLMNVITNYLRPKWGLVFPAPPVVSISTPTNGATLSVNTLIPVSISVTSGSTNPIASVAVWANGSLVGTATAAPFALDISSLIPGNVSLTAIATDSAGNRSTSPPVNLTITGPAAPATPPTNGLQVWLDAGSGLTTNADGTVASWTDRSGNGNNATPTNFAPATVINHSFFPVGSPIYSNNVVNGKPALHFYGTNMLCVADLGVQFLAGDFTTFNMVRFRGYLWDGRAEMVWSKSSNNMPQPIDWYLPGVGGGVESFLRGYGSFGFAGASSPTRDIPIDQFVNVGMIWQGTTGTMYAGGAPFYSTTIVSPTGDASNLPLTIGMRDDTGTANFGDIAEILIYQGALSASNVAGVTSYLNSKYGLAQANMGYASPSPSIAVTVPTNGSSVSFPATVTVSGSAASALGSIASVRLFVNGNSVGTFATNSFNVPVSVTSPGQVTITAVATDNWGVTSTSPPVVVNVSGALNASPLTNGLVIWLKGGSGLVLSNNSVIEWDDQSGFGNNAYQPSFDGSVGLPPVIVSNAVNGFPAVHFTPPFGSNVFLDIAPPAQFANGLGSNTTMNFAIFTVLRIPIYGATMEVLGEVAANGTAQPFEYRVLSSSGNPTLNVGSGPGNTLQTYTATSAPAASATYFVVEGVAISNGVATHYWGTTPLAAPHTFTDAANLGQTGVTPLRIGVRQNLSFNLQGDIAELMIYTNGLSSAQIAQTVNYMSAKYAIPQVQVGQPATLSISVVSLNSVSVSWPTAYHGWILQSSTDLVNWSTVATDPPNNQVSVATGPIAKFYRLIGQ